MSGRVKMHLAPRFMEVYNWLNEIVGRNPLRHNEIMDSAKTFMIANTECTVEKFEEIKFGFGSLIIDDNDLPLLGLYHHYLDKIRKSEQ